MEILRAPRGLRTFVLSHLSLTQSSESGWILIDVEGVIFEIGILNIRVGLRRRDLGKRGCVECIVTTCESAIHRGKGICKVGHVGKRLRVS